MDRIGHAFFRVWRVPRVVLGKRIRFVLRVVFKVQMVVAGVVVGFNLPRTVSRGDVLGQKAVVAIGVAHSSD